LAEALFQPPQRGVTGKLSADSVSDVAGDAVGLMAGYQLT
jgi:hypothetical protein